MATAYINSEMLNWALERSDVSASELGSALKKSEETVTSWITGDARPSFSQAQDVARRLRIPFGYLFLAEPPTEDLPIPDFRRNAQAGTISNDLRDVISDVLIKQDWYREYRQDEEGKALSFVGSHTKDSAPSIVAQDIASALKIESEVRPERNRDSFLRALVRQVESIGILVMRNGIVKQATNRPLRVDEFRGFSLADPMAPVIFINNTDSTAAQAFTVAHELGHIWIGEGGISDADQTYASGSTANIEAFCNQVAGEVLLPWSELFPKWSKREVSVSEWIEQIALESHVASVMVARQLWEHKEISRDTFFQLYELEKSKWVGKSKGGSSGGDYYINVPIRNSRLLTERVLESVQATNTSHREASRILGVKPAKLKQLQESLSS